MTEITPFFPIFQLDIEASDAELREYEARLDRLREKRRASEQRTAERKAGMLPAREPEAEAASLECYLREREEREKLRALCRAIQEGDEATARAWLDGGGQINAMYEYERDSKGQPIYLQDTAGACSQRERKLVWQAQARGGAGPDAAAARR